MNRERLSVTVEFSSAIALLLVVVLPLLAISGTGVGTYYAAWTLGPSSIGVLALLTFLAILARESGLVTRETLAGLGLGFGSAMLLIAGAWAIFVPRQMVMGLPTGQAMLFHRWVVLLLSGIACVSSISYASAVLRQGPAER